MKKLTEYENFPMFLAFGVIVFILLISFIAL